MTNDIREYKGLSDEEKEYLREFDKAVERGIFKDKLVKLSKNLKKQIRNERYAFRNDLMVTNSRNGSDIDNIIVNDKPYVIRKSTKNKSRDEKGKFIKKEDK